MINFFLTWLLAAIALSITAYLVPGLDLDSWQAAAVGAIVMGLVNAILTLPLTLLTLGLFLFAVNAISLYLVAEFTPGFTINGFWPALWGSIVLSLVSWGMSQIANQAE
ncbi:phage holin family protein [Limnospira platensis]|uniref:phage holin family protein n=1 Tax=Limnospira platensis TaxID=118562 RepID=UPI0002803D2F|nr:hypothetical protein SPLC1_S231000 [Arthrospira platensis C1]UWU46615.1 putative membrane protein [Arthrospira platensis C1]